MVGSTSPYPFKERPLWHLKIESAGYNKKQITDEVTIQHKI